MSTPNVIASSSGWHTRLRRSVTSRAITRRARSLCSGIFSAVDRWQAQHNTQLGVATGAARLLGRKMPNWLLLASAGAVIMGAGRLLHAQLDRWQRSKRRNVRQGKPLSKVVAMCEARWFLEDLKLAMHGDQEAMVRVGHMLLSGYGIRQDKQEAAKWLRQAWAIQNYKEPIMLDILDVDNSPVHAMHSRGDCQPAAPANASTSTIVHSGAVPAAARKAQEASLRASGAAEAQQLHHMEQRHGEQRKWERGQQQQQRQRQQQQQRQPCQTPMEVSDWSDLCMDIQSVYRSLNYQGPGQSSIPAQSSATPAVDHINGTARTPVAGQQRTSMQNSMSTANSPCRSVFRRQPHATQQGPTC